MREKEQDARFELRLEKDLLEKAQAAARLKDKTLSELVRAYLKRLTR